MKLKTMKWVLDKLEVWIQSATNKEREAVNKFLDALNETNKYLGRISKDMALANRKSEEELSTLWNEAAKSVRGIDEDLYSRCIAKACSWANSDRFEISEMKDINISIEKMLEIAKRKGLV